MNIIIIIKHAYNNNILVPPPKLDEVFYRPDE